MQDISDHSAYLLVMTNLPDEQSARTLARDLVERRLSACVNISSAIHSIYRWQNAVEEAAEFTLFIKTSRRRYTEVQKAIKAAHPYEMPEIIALPIDAGLPAYLGWITQQTTKDTDA
jgi:periplasmic divalent cation tolerance protein